MYSSWDKAPLNAAERGRRVEPVMVTRRRRISLSGMVASAPFCRAMMTIRPSSAAQARSLGR
ncbi:hypothetical protein CF98_26900 [Halopseudomonas bauzanensis]|nr:hypothetical protein CF98_26900 [Halopseudomonas bauzanensis]